MNRSVANLVGVSTIQMKFMKTLFGVLMRWYKKIILREKSKQSVLQIRGKLLLLLTEQLDSH
jgi:hypothetical protein